MIRLATEADIPRMEELVQEYYAKLPHSKYGEYSVNKVRSLLRDYVTSPKEQKIIFLAETNGYVYGLLAGIALEMVFSTEKKAYESVWYVQEKFAHLPGAIRMLKAYEYWAKITGCTSVCMSMVGDNDSLEKMYFKSGYEKLEQSFTKGIR